MVPPNRQEPSYDRYGSMHAGGQAGALKMPEGKTLIP